jgi:hypothetical protein
MKSVLLGSQAAVPVFLTSAHVEALSGTNMRTVRWTANAPCS